VIDKIVLPCASPLAEQPTAKAAAASTTLKLLNGGAGYPNLYVVPEPGYRSGRQTDSRPELQEHEGRLQQDVRW
jgi:hypothetical protein